MAALCECISEREGLSTFQCWGPGVPGQAGGPLLCSGLPGAGLSLWRGRPGPGSAAHRPPQGKLWSVPHAGPECVPLASSRVGQRGSGLSMSAARSEHEVSEIIDGLSEQEVSLRP